jgi:hypothetical protein
VTFTDMFGIEWDDDDPIMYQWVCVTHKRHIPCREDNDECRLSRDEDDVKAVRCYQQGNEE